LSREELARRVVSQDLMVHVDRLVRSRRLLDLRICRRTPLIAAEDAAPLPVMGWGFRCLRGCPRR